MALIEGAGAAVNIAEIIKQLIGQASMKIHCYIDNKSLVESLSSYKQVKDRRLRVDTRVLEDMLEQGEIKKLIWVNSSQQLEDCLTKRGVQTNSKLQSVENRMFDCKYMYIIVKEKKILEKKKGRRRW